MTTAALDANADAPRRDPTVRDGEWFERTLQKSFGPTCSWLACLRSSFAAPGYWSIAGIL
jgi:hypothetical protein